MATAQKYQEVAQLVKDHLLTELKDEIHSIILFGSVARGDANEESDIDFLVISDAPFETKQRMYEIASDIGLDHAIFVQIVLFRPQAFEDEAIKFRSYFSSDVLTQGEVLHDDGTYQRIRDKALAAISGTT